MGHEHSHSGHDHATENIRYAFFLNLVFTLFEIAGGIYTNSLAIMSDALHDLGDSLSLGLSWYLSKLSGKKRTEVFSYGYRRFSLLAAFINGLVLIAGSLIILSEAIPRLITPEHSNAMGMLIFAIIGVAVNGAAVMRLKGGKTMNERVVAWHLLEDVLGWVAVLIISIIMLIRDIHILDPILSILITFYILWNVGKNLKKTVMIFLQSVPESLEIKNIEKALLSTSGVKGVHDTHIWSLDGEHHVLTTHVIIGKDSTQQVAADIKFGAKVSLKEMGVSHITIEIETEGEKCELDVC